MSEDESEPHLAVASEFPPPRSFREGSRPRLPEVALSLDGGESFRMHLGDLYLASVDPTTGVESVYQFPLRIEPRAVLGSSVTLHPSGFLSHEIYFGTLQANLPAGEDPGPQVDRIKKRTAGYQLEGNRGAPTLARRYQCGHRASCGTPTKISTTPGYSSAAGERAFVSRINPVSPGPASRGQPLRRPLR